jgi:uncharacterized membrane protein (UPF0127 family)
MKKYISFLIVILFLGICTFLILNKKVEPQVKDIPKTIVPDFAFVQIKNIELKVEVADTPSKRELGLSGHSPLNGNEGMLFIFDTEGNYPFWMKDMLFSIDIIWLDANKKIVLIKHDAKPESFPESFGGEVKAKYVLEVSSGFAKQNNLKIGDRVEF